jgi:hypothetical protein
MSEEEAETAAKKKQVCVCVCVCVTLKPSLLCFCNVVQLQQRQHCHVWSCIFLSTVWCTADMVHPQLHHPAQAMELKASGNELYKSRKFDEAIDAYTRALELFDADVSFLTNRQGRSRCHHLLQLVLCCVALYCIVLYCTALYCMPLFIQYRNHFQPLLPSCARCPTHINCPICTQTHTTGQPCTLKKVTMKPPSRTAMMQCPGAESCAPIMPSSRVHLHARAPH